MAVWIDCETGKIKCDDAIRSTPDRYDLMRQSAREWIDDCDGIPQAACNISAWVGQTFREHGLPPLTMAERKALTE